VRMRLSLSERAKMMWAFALSASAAPLTFTLQCGFACFSCPLSGMCVIASPFLILAAVAIKAVRGVSRQGRGAPRAART